MKYFLDLFSPETSKAFTNSNKDISGFRISRKTYIENQNIGPGDKFICYVTKLQRFIGVFELLSKHFVDSKPIFSSDNDPFTLRFRVKPTVWLPLEKAIPIHEDVIWNTLSFTKTLSKDNNRWTHMVFSSPKLWPQDDCVFLERVLLKQNKELIDYPLSEDDLAKIKPSKMRISDKKEVSVFIPDEPSHKITQPVSSPEKEARNSIKIQAQLAEIGEILGLKIWLPNSDKERVCDIWKPKGDSLLNELPLVFDENTLKTIRNIDVLWINRRSIVRAFEVEDTTSIYSGILRMADLLALQPMLNIKIHIVAPTERMEAVFAQIKRPVFADIGGRSLSEVCSYLSYDSIQEIAREKKLKHMTDSIIDDYSQYTEE